MQGHSRFTSPLSALTLVLAGVLLSGGALSAQEGWGVTIPYHREVLPNGLTLIVHEDHKAPIVAVNVWYHVGSKNEVPGRTGFAHLFEHLMFNGSENFDDDYFKVLTPVGATNLNGTTSFDRTNYFQNVPTGALDVALWMESDRMGHLQGAISQERLDEQRGVVQNEKRQGENQPYGRVFATILENVFPLGHPYHWSVIGSMEDLDAASLEDVHHWFDTYYGAQNAVLVVAGDVDTKDVIARVERFFGDIDPGPPLERPQVSIPRLSGAKRRTMQDRVPRARLYKVWVAPEWGSADADLLNLAGRVLSSGKSSRLYKRLVYDDQIATDVFARPVANEIAGLFIVQATARPGVELARIERAVDEEIARFLVEGPTEAELRREKTQLKSSFIRGVEQIGGFGGKSDVLAMSQVYGGSPDFYLTSQDRQREASTADVRSAAQRWLTDDVFALEVQPYPKLEVSERGVDRSSGPPAAQPEEPGWLPALERATLSNGIEVILARRDAVPVVHLRLLVDAGYAADPLSKPGIADLAVDMLDEGTTSRTALEISDALQDLGASLATWSSLDTSNVQLSALSDDLDASLDLFADVALHPAFPEADFERLKKNQLAAIQSEKVNPRAMAMRVIPRLLFGKDHAYGRPATGSGFERSVEQITRQDLREYYDTWFRPNNAKIVVVGATTLEDMVPKLEQRFAGWERAEVPTKKLDPVAPPKASVIYLLDRPDAVQSVVAAAYLAPPSNTPNEAAIEVMNGVLGGGFNARLNMNLREDKGWSYGARSSLPDALGQRLYIAQAPVQTDKTSDSLREMMDELRAVGGDRPPSQAELERVKNERTLSLAGRWETAQSVLGTICQMVTYGLPDDYYDGYAQRLRAVSAEEARAASDMIVPGRTVWVVVGDRAKVERNLRNLDVAPVVLLDADGEVVGGQVPSGSR